MAHTGTSMPPLVCRTALCHDKFCQMRDMLFYIHDHLTKNLKCMIAWAIFCPLSKESTEIRTDHSKATIEFTADTFTPLPSFTFVAFFTKYSTELAEGNTGRQSVCRNTISTAIMSGKRGNNDSEREIFQRFSLIVKEKLTSIADNADNGGGKMKQLDTLYQRPEYDAEKRILNEMNNMGLGKGMLAGLGCFVFLRWSPGAGARILRRRAGLGRASEPVSPFRSSSGYQLDPVAPAAESNARRPGLLFHFFRLTLDTFVSFSVGAYTSLYFIDKQKMMKQFADIPLVEGEGPSYNDAGLSARSHPSPFWLS